MYALSPDAESGLVAHALPKGTRIADRFVVERKLGDGTAASVYRAMDEIAGVAVALKVFDPLRGADAVARSRFQREFDILSRLSERGVARAIDFLPGDDFDVLVLELVEGTSLRERLDRGPMELDEALRLAAALADTLDACHRAGVVHRDLKPTNIVLHPDRGPVILDFGVAWFSSAMTLTRTGAIVGSPRYLAPETFESSDVDERVDIYALGAILFEALSGRYARDADTVVEMVGSEASREAPSVREVAPNVPVRIDRVVAQALAPRPEERFATAHELKRALEGASSAVGRPLERNLSCRACGTSTIVDLSICPGCGAPTEWSLERGAFAVQILEADEPARAARWLAQRYGTAMRMDRRMLARRLETLPAPLAVGISSRTAEALASAARAAGCRAEIVRTRSMLGPALRFPGFSASQILFGMGAHFASVLAVGSAGILLGASEDAIVALPFLMGALGFGATWAWARVPLLSLATFDRRAFVHPALDQIRSRLCELGSPRARRLAAGAIARAAPMLLGDDAGLSEEAKTEVLEALDEALDAAANLDAHRAVLDARPRARLRALAARVDRDADPEQARALDSAQEEIGAIAVEHDLAARRALEATEAISEILATRGG